MVGCGGFRLLRSAARIADPLAAHAGGRGEICFERLSFFRVCCVRVRRHIQAETVESRSRRTEKKIGIPHLACLP